MNQEITIIIGFLIMAYWLLFYESSPTTKIQTDDSNYLINKYGLTENEYRTFTYIADPVKRDQYLNHVIRSKQKN